MAEEPESALQLPPSVAAEGEGPTEVSPETATPEPPSSAAVSPGTEEPAGDTKKKIDILLKAVGDTPIMKTKKWAVERTRTIQGLIDFIKKFLKLVASEQLVINIPLPCAVEELRGIQLTLEQHEFELWQSTYTWIFFQ
ncbi:ubiquitin-like protein ATG12 isoform X1 [Balaenoptera ricei]|uniref:ubiquitin-like protein ATG12 isoform X1 n=1 Tax=Balaenoptera ricei TaxID=2746895 RepID=UPI0028BD6809|nr:ubiquitin-like protein ATG12 isoform X1 [Balaenoptera ricei]